MPKHITFKLNKPRRKYTRDIWRHKTPKYRTPRLLKYKTIPKRAAEFKLAFFHTNPFTGRTTWQTFSFTDQAFFDSMLGLVYDNTVIKEWNTRIALLQFVLLGLTMDDQSLANSEHRILLIDNPFFKRAREDLGIHQLLSQKVSIGRFEDNPDAGIAKIPLFYSDMH